MSIKVIRYYNTTTLKLFQSLFVLNDRISKYLEESVHHNYLQFLAHNQEIILLHHLLND